MINNFDLLRPLLQFDKPGDCYFLQILKRRKDNPGMERDMEVIDNIFFYSVEDTEKKMTRVINTCNRENARAYLRVNRRNTEKLALMTLKKLTDYIISTDYKAAKNAYLSAAGENHSEPMKRWIVDIDRQEWMSPVKDWEDYKNRIINCINGLHGQANNDSAMRYKILTEIPTLNGIHIICNPFNLKEFNKEFEWHKLIHNPTPAPDIHKDNPTLLYIP
jgi:hypothetical protein